MNAPNSEIYSAANSASVPLHSNRMLIKMGQIKTYANKIIIIPQFPGKTFQIKPSVWIGSAMSFHLMGANFLFASYNRLGIAAANTRTDSLHAASLQTNSLRSKLLPKVK